MKTNKYIADLHDELELLYWGSESFVSEDQIQLRIGYTKFNKETGTEIGADLFLNPPRERKEMPEFIENKAGDLGDDLCNAALFNYQESTVLEPDFEELEDNFQDKPSDWIAPAQQKLNFEFYMERLAKAKNFRELKIVRESVIAGQKGSWFFLKRSDAKIFWKAYVDKATELDQKFKKYKKRSA